MSGFQPQGRALSDLTNLLQKTSASFVVGLSLLPPNQQLAILNAGQKVLSQQQENNLPTAPSKVQKKRAGKWSKDEDARLAELVDKKGARNWRLIGNLHGTRDAKQCRDRWTQYLDPSLVKTAFSEDDCRIIMEAVEQGQKWSYLANVLPGRSANDIKNYYNHHLKRKRKEVIPTDEPTAKRRQLVNETILAQPNRIQPQPSLAQTVFALAPPVPIESVLPPREAPNIACKPAQEPNMIDFNSVPLPQRALPPLPAAFINDRPIESTTTVLSSSPTHHRLTDTSTMSLLSPLFEPIRPLHAEQHQELMPPPPAMSTPVRTNLLTRFDAELEPQNGIVCETGHPQMEPNNLSFFFCDEELDRIGEPEIAIQQAIHTDLSFM